MKNLIYFMFMLFLSFLNQGMDKLSRPLPEEFGEDKKFLIKEVILTFAV